MGKFFNNLLTFIESVQPYIYVLVAGSLLILGIMCVYPSEDTKEKAKKAMPWVIIGCGLAMGAVVVAKAVTNSFSF